MDVWILGLAGAAELLGLLSVALVISLCVKFLGGFGFTNLLVFNFHPFLMVFGMIFLYGNSVIIYRVLHIKKLPVKIGHSVINLLAFVMLVLGLVSAFRTHNFYNWPHLYSLHSWFGIITAVLFPAQLLFGCISFLFPGLPPPVKCIVLPYHQTAGKIIFFFATVATLTGLMNYAATLSTYYSKDTQAYLINFLSLSIALFATLVAVVALTDRFKRRDDEEVDGDEDTFIVQSS